MLSRPAREFFALTDANSRLARGLLLGRHSGFSVHSAIRVAPWDTEGVERLCRYLGHPPIALGRLR